MGPKKGKKGKGKGNEDESKSSDQMDVKRKQTRKMSKMSAKAAIKWT